MTMAYSLCVWSCPSPHIFQFPSFHYKKTPSTHFLPQFNSIPLHNFTSMEFRPKNGFNLEEDDPAGEFSVSGDGDRRRRPGGGGGKRGGAGSGGAAPPYCQADACPAMLTEAKRYHRRHKVCEYHAKSAVVMVAGLRQRFCQQCSRFHELSEFDDAKRSCRRRLAGHNERRRKSSSSEPSGDVAGGPAIKLEPSSSPSGIRGQIQCRASSSDEKSRAGISNASNSGSSATAYNHFQIG